MQEGLWNLSFSVDKDSILTKIWIFKSCVDIEMINTWTQARSYHGHFERSQTILLRYQTKQTHTKNTTVYEKNTITQRFSQPLL